LLPAPWRCTRQQIPQRLTPFRNDKNVEIVLGFALAEVTTGCATIFARRRGLGAFVISTEGRNLIVAGTMALQAAADSSTANAVSE
jgi:hypothetical protein